MNKLFIFLFYTLISSSLHAMNFEVVSTVERGESITEETKIAPSRKVIIFNGYVRNLATQEIFKASSNVNINRLL